MANALSALHPDLGQVPLFVGELECSDTTQNTHSLLVSTCMYV